MNRAMRATVVLLLGAALASPAAAQVRRNAFTPFVSYALPLGNLASGPNLDMKATGGVMVGITGELGISKVFAISAFAGSTVGLTQSFKVNDKLGGDEITFGAATTQVGATLVFRPLGTLPNGGPRSFFLEAGGGLNILSVADITARSGGNSLRLSDNYPVITFGGGLSFPIGPRATGLIFARYNLAMTEYNSAWLKDWNAVPPIDSDPGKKVSVLLVGVGIRTGF
jgi:hypothetical protein